MIFSMTGFGRAIELNQEHKILVEIKAVNHRYLDLNIKMARRFNVFEHAVRKLLGEYIKRGKVDVYISYENYKEKANGLRYNYEAAKSYYDFCMQMQEDFGITNDLKTSTLARLPEVISLSEEAENEERIWGLLKPVLEQALTQLQASRLEEGANLQADLLEKLELMSKALSLIEEKSPSLAQEYKKKLEDKVGELLAGTGIEESRILAEVCIYADKICVDEELVRLKSHIEAVKKSLLTEGEVGRKLDFIAQEMNRESNTILSKSSNLEIADTAIFLKTEIEKIREQIQNIE